MFEKNILKMIKNAKGESMDTSEYIEGLEIALEIWEDSENKEDLVKRLTEKVQMLLDEDVYDTTQALISALGLAMKDTGTIKLDKYVVHTSVDEIVQLEDGSGVPLKFVGNENFKKEWTMPELLLFDKEFTKFAKKVTA